MKGRYRATFCAAASGNTAGICFPAIPDTIHRADERLFFVKRFQLAAQVLDMAVDGAVGDHAIIIIEMTSATARGKTLSPARETAF